MDDSLAALSRELFRLERAVLSEDANPTPPIPHPLGALSTAVLEHLLNAGPDRPSSVAGALNISGPAASRVLRKLSARGLIEDRASRTDRRSHDVVITPAGAAALEIQQTSRRHAIQRIFVEWTEAEVASLAASLARLNDCVAEAWRESAGERASLAAGAAEEPPSGGRSDL